MSQLLCDGALQCACRDGAIVGDDLAKQTAPYVDKILTGATPAELPVEQPTKFELVINLKTARELGLTISRDFLLVADDVVE